MDIKVHDKHEIKCEPSIKSDILDSEFYEQNNININEEPKNVYYNSKTAEKVSIKEEKNDFEEEIHELKDICIKSEICMDNCGLDENKCTSEVSQNYRLRQIKVHTVEKNYECLICGKSFSENVYLKAHLLAHTVEKKYKCDICEKLFSHRSNLKRHMLIHSNQNNFKCTICDKSFSHRTSLNRHLIVHTAEKNYKCDVCEKSFKQKSYLKKHMLVHTGEKNFKCAICDKSFSQKMELKIHIVTHNNILKVMDDGK